jgi:hypothetical protein
MRGRPIEMRHVRETLRLKAAGASNRTIAGCLGIARSTVNEHGRGALRLRTAVRHVAWRSAGSVPELDAAQASGHSLQPGMNSELARCESLIAGAFGRTQ